jgi:hypothetical protein
MSIKVKVNGQWIEQTSNNLDGAVLYNVTQGLTQEEQNKARENINTPSFDDIPDSISDLDNDSNFLSGTDVTLKEAGKAADAQAVGAALNEKQPVGDYATEDYVDGIVDTLPIIVDGNYTDIVGMRLATDIRVVMGENMITVTTTLEGNKTASSIVTLNENGYPSVISTDGIECKLTWVGFDDVQV